MAREHCPNHIRERTLMGRKLIMAVSLLFWMTAAAYGERIQIGAKGDDVNVVVEESNDYRTVVRIDINAFEKAPVEIDGVEHFLLN